MQELLHQTWRHRNVGLHFFEHRDPELTTLLEASKRIVLETSWWPRFFQGVLQHVAFALPDEQAASSHANGCISMT